MTDYLSESGFKKYLLKKMGYSEQHHKCANCEFSISPADDPSRLICRLNRIIDIDVDFNGCCNFHKRTLNED